MDHTLVIAGQLCRQYLIPPEGKPLLDTPGGNLLYAAAGARLWRDSVSLLARVGEDYPNHWLRSFQQQGLNTNGVKILPAPMDLRSFIVYIDKQNFQRANPVSHFARLGLPFPKGLLGYQTPQDEQDKRSQANPNSPKLSDIPHEYRTAKAVHLAPLDLLTHSQLSAAFRHSNVSYITIDPGPGYMNAHYLNDLRSLLQGITAFLPSEEEIRSLFWGRTHDLWEMAETLAGFGCDMVVIKRGARGQYVYDRLGNRKWELPGYPSNYVDPTGAGDAFCGGFLAGYQASLDPLQAALHGNIASSFAIEGSAPFYLLDTMPGLAQTRLASLADLVRQV